MIDHLSRLHKAKGKGREGGKSGGKGKGGEGKSKGPSDIYRHPRVKVKGRQELQYRTGKLMQWQGQCIQRTLGNKGEKVVGSLFCAGGEKGETGQIPNFSNSSNKQGHNQ